MKQKFIDYYMDIADLTSKLSSAIRLNVGAVIVKGNKILGTGYNGMPTGWTNECEEVIEVHEDGGVVTKTKDEVIHAEANAILKLARDGESGNGSILFCTHAPCVQCAKLIHGAGISKMYYRDSYRDELGIDFLKKCNIEVIKIKEIENE